MGYDDETERALQEDAEITKKAIQEDSGIIDEGERPREREERRERIGKRKPIRESLRKKLLHRAGGNCEYCDRPFLGGAFERGKTSNFHHINKNRDDNRMDNIVVLCPNCHDDAEHDRISKDELLNIVEGVGGRF